MRELMLLIDTAGGDGSLALASLGAAPQVLRSAVLPGRSASERLFPELRRLLVEEGCSAADVRAISVVLGPGSFTGVRVGVAAAKGMAEALQVPVIGLSRLAVLVSAARAQLATEDRDVLALLDAGRGEVFAGRSGRGEHGVEWEGLLTVAEAARLRTDLLLVLSESQVREAVAKAVADETGLRSPGLPDGFSVCGGPSSGGEVSVQFVPLEAASGLPLAAQRMHAGLLADVALLDAHYLRRTPAEMARQGSEARGAESAQTFDGARSPQ